MKRTKQLIMSFVAIAVLGVGASARAQDSSTPPPSEPPPAAHSSSNSVSLGGGAGIGVGATFTLSGLGAPGRPGSLSTMRRCSTSRRCSDSRAPRSPGAIAGPIGVFGVGGWYHFHRGSSSDFSLGALIAIDTTLRRRAVDDAHRRSNRGEVRAFVTPNVAVFGRVGLAFLFGDTGNGTNFGLGGRAGRRVRLHVLLPVRIVFRRP